MDSHAVLLPAVALVDPAGVGERLLISQRGPGKATYIIVDQADIAPPAVIYGHVDDGVGVGGAHQAAVLPVLTVGAGHLIGGWKLTVHPDISLQVSETWKHLRPTWSEQKRSHCVHVTLVRHHYAAKEEKGRGEKVQLHSD